MKVALLTNGIWPYIIGGMQKHSYYLCKYLAKEKVYIVVFYPANRTLDSGRLNEFFSEEEQVFISWVEIPDSPKYHFPGHYIYESFVLSKNIYSYLTARKEEYDLLYVQGFSGCYTILHNRQRGKTPIILNFHGLEMFQKSISFKNWLEQMLFRPFVRYLLYKADYVQSLGDNLTRLLLKMGIATHKIIELGIGIENSWISGSTPPSDKKRVFTFIGRYEKRKGILELNHVLKDILPKYDFDFHFIGPIPQEQEIMSSNIIYHGLVKDESLIKRVLSVTDFLVVPSFSEGMPTVILEAMALGCAIIASDVGAVNEQVSEKNGILIPPGSITKLYHAIEKAILMKESSLQEMKDYSLYLIKEQFTWDIQIRKMIREFQSIIQKEK